MALARHGYRLVLAARTFDDLATTRALSGLAPADALIVLIDLAAEDAPDNLFDTALEFYGRVDLLINNAGWAPARRPLVKTTPADQDRMIATNLRAPIALCRLAAGHMTARGSGIIVNVASSAGRTTPAGEAVYAATKAGLIAFTHACFAELRQKGVRVSVLIPGLVDTTLIPANKHLARARMITPEQVAQSVLQIVQSPAGTCPLELTLVPQFDPERQH